MTMRPSDAAKRIDEIQKQIKELETEAARIKAGVKEYMQKNNLQSLPIDDEYEYAFIEKTVKEYNVDGLLQFFPAERVLRMCKVQKTAVDAHKTSLVPEDKVKLDATATEKVTKYLAKKKIKKS